MRQVRPSYHLLDLTSPPELNTKLVGVDLDGI